MPFFCPDCLPTIRSLGGAGPVAAACGIWLGARLLDQGTEGLAMSGPYFCDYWLGLLNLVLWRSKIPRPQTVGPQKSATHSPTFVLETIRPQIFSWTFFASRPVYLFHGKSIYSLDGSIPVVQPKFRVEENATYFLHSIAIFVHTFVPMNFLIF